MVTPTCLTRTHSVATRVTRSTSSLAAASLPPSPPNVSGRIVAAASGRSRRMGDLKRPMNACCRTLLWSSCAGVRAGWQHNHQQRIYSKVDVFLPSKHDLRSKVSRVVGTCNISLLYLTGLLQCRYHFPVVLLLLLLLMDRSGWIVVQ